MINLQSQCILQIWTTFPKNDVISAIKHWRTLPPLEQAIAYIDTGMKDHLDNLQIAAISSRLPAEL